VGAADWLFFVPTNAIDAEKPIDPLKLVQALFLDSVGNPGSPTK
jgi:hypothetical protein